MIRTLALTLLLAALAASAAAQQSTVNYTGTLLDAQGDPIPMGTRDVAISLWDAQSGGTMLWGPQSFDNVPIRPGGRFSVVLTQDGEGDPVATGLDADFVFLQITLDGSPLAPRQFLASAAMAFRARGTTGALVTNEVVVPETQMRSTTVTAEFTGRPILITVNAETDDSTGNNPLSTIRITEAATGRVVAEWLELAVMTISRMAVDTVPATEGRAPGTIVYEVEVLNNGVEALNPTYSVQAFEFGPAGWEVAP